MSVSERKRKIEAFTREEILEAAQRVLKEGGYKNFSLSKVATYTTLSRASIYNYFKNREDLFSFMLNEFISRAIEEAIEKLRSVNDGWQKIRALVNVMFSQYIKYGYLKEVFMLAMYEGAVPRESLQPIFDAKIDLMTQIFTEYAMEGSPAARSPRSVACLFLHGFFDRLEEYQTMSQEEINEYIQIVAECIYSSMVCMQRVDNNAL